MSSIFANVKQLLSCFIHQVLQADVTSFANSLFFLGTVGSLLAVSEMERVGGESPLKATSAPRVQLRSDFLKYDLAHCFLISCLRLYVRIFSLAGTFTLSNLGMFGVDRFDAILPPGQVLLLKRKLWKDWCLLMLIL